MICYLESRKKGEATNEEKDDRKHEQPSQFIRRLDKLSMIEATGTDKDHVVGLNMQRKSSRLMKGCSSLGQGLCNRVDDLHDRDHKQSFWVRLEWRGPTYLDKQRGGDGQTQPVRNLLVLLLT